MNLTRTTSLATLSDLYPTPILHKHCISDTKLTSFEKAFLAKLSQRERPKIRVKFYPEDTDVSNADFLIEPFKTHRITGRNIDLETANQATHKSRKCSLAGITGVSYEQHLPPLRDYSRVIIKCKKAFDYTLDLRSKDRTTGVMKHVLHFPKPDKRT